MEETQVYRLREEPGDAARPWQIVDAEGEIVFRFEPHDCGSALATLERLHSAAGADDD